VRFLVLKHLDIEGPGLLADVIRSAGHELKTMDLWRHLPEPGAMDGYDGLIVMGGPSSANDLHSPSIAAALALIRAAIDHHTPMLGICLGAQLMAKAASATIQPSPVRELGWYPVYPTSQSANDPLFASIHEDSLMVFQWHGETFTLPESATLLASNPAVPNQAFRLARGQYALQFHIEVDRDTIETWINAGKSEREHLGDSGLGHLRRETEVRLGPMQTFCSTMTHQWLKEIKLLQS